MSNADTILRRKKWGEVLAFSLLFSTLCACGKSKKHPDPLFRDIFVHGDPMNFVAGATTHEDTPWEAEKDLDIGEYNLIGRVQFIERDKQRPISQDRDLEKENAPSEEEVPNKNESSKEEIAPFTLKSSGNQIWSFSNGVAGFNLKPSQMGYLQVFEFVGSEGEKYPVKPIHFSCKDDCRLMRFFGTVEL